MPLLARTSGGVEAWVMMAGCSIRLSTPPRLSARVKRRVRSRSRIAVSARTRAIAPFITMAALSSLLEELPLATAEASGLHEGRRAEHISDPARRAPGRREGALRGGPCGADQEDVPQRAARSDRDPNH